MRTCPVVAALCNAVVVFASVAVVGQQAQGPAAPPRNASPANMPLETLQDMFIRFPLPPGQQVYADIDGRHMHRYVVDQDGYVWFSGRADEIIKIAAHRMGTIEDEGSVDETRLAWKQMKAELDRRHV